jgi:hypothetical protein
VDHSLGGTLADPTSVKNKRNEKAAKFSVPLPKVRGIAEEEMFKVVKTGKKTAKKGWKRMITKPTFVVSQIPIEKKAQEPRAVLGAKETHSTGCGIMAHKTARRLFGSLLQSSSCHTKLLGRDQTSLGDPLR